jgi:hypothetical protein
MSEVAICNQALALLGVPPIVSFDDGTTPSNLCSQLYAGLRDQVLEERAWTFATGRATLLPDATPPDFQYSNRFQIPSTWIRILGVNKTIAQPGAEDTRIPFPWNKEGNYILASADKVYVNYVQKVTDASLFSPAFRDCLAYRLAADMAISLRQSTTLMQDMTSLYAAKLNQAALKDGAQGSRQNKYVGSYILGRG